jgi:hypothetical protein
MNFFSQVDRYGVRIRSFTAVNDAVYDRIHAIYAPYTIVFRRIIWSSITVVYLRGRIRKNTETAYGAFTLVNDRVFSVYGRKRASLENYGTLTMDLSRFMPISSEMEPTYRPVDCFHLWSPLRSDWFLKISWSKRKKTKLNKLRKILSSRRMFNRSDLK